MFEHFFAAKPVLVAVAAGAVSHTANLAQTASLHIPPAPPARNLNLLPDLFFFSSPTTLSFSYVTCDGPTRVFTRALRRGAEMRGAAHTWLHSLATSLPATLVFVVTAYQLNKVL